MLKRFSAILVIALIALFVIMGCEGKKGPTGPSGTADCVQCHSDDTQIVAMAGQWSNSVHASGNNIRRNTPPCSGCHTSEGFVQRLATGDPGTQLNPSPIGCFTCHEPHTNKNFNLRTEAAVTLLVGGTFDMGAGNLCANCHQARVPEPPVSATGNTIITSTHWGPHDSPQANILSGSGAFVFNGATYNSSYHATHMTDGCPTCHMATPRGEEAGGHTMSMTYNDGTSDYTTGCKTTGCHSSMTDFNYHGVQDSTEALISALLGRLNALGIVDVNGELDFADSLMLPTAQAGALYNLFLFETDRSLGVHNTQFTFDALNASIEALAGQ